MEPNSFGKKLGIGMRVAGRIAKERAQAAQRTGERPISAAAAPEVIAPNPQRAAQEAARRRAAEMAEKGRNLGHGIGRGSRNFSQSFFRPFAHASSVLWLEITGCFFALFALFFGQNIWHLRAQYAAGPAHNTFLLYCLLTAVFAYFSASSFVRARSRARRQASGR